MINRSFLDLKYEAIYRNKENRNIQLLCKLQIE